MRRFLPGLLFDLCCLAIVGVAVHAAEEQPAKPEPAAAGTAAVSPAASPTVPPSTPGTPDASTATDTVEEPDLAELPLSNAARVRLDRARDSIVQIRGFVGKAPSSAFHGSGFAVGPDGFIITNYHVVADAVLHPQRYRLEYVTADDRTGRLRVYAVDVHNDLAVVKAEELRLPPLRLRTDIPRQGARAYSIGFPLNLGLTITEGVANGLVASGFDQRIHYTGAINSGMSGGPALDAGGSAYGVNVSVNAARQLVGFVVPARHIEPLLKRASKPLDETLSAQQARDLMAQQALTYESVIFEPLQSATTTQTLNGYTLPARMGPAFDCYTTGGSEAERQLQIETISCATPPGVLLQFDLPVGQIQFEHRLIRGQDLHPLQFSQRVNSVARNFMRAGSERHVAPFACRDALVSLDGFDARISTCARQYRLFAGLYDIAVTVTSINSTQRAVVSQLDLRGVGFEPGMQFVRRYLGAMRWIP
jgi:S1-C subfamily serine protease